MEKIVQNDRTKVRRVPKRGRYDYETIQTILKAGLLCHVAIVENDKPLVIPMIYGTIGDQLYIHGSRASRLIKAALTEVSIAVTIPDGLVLARSAFHHSMNYRSVVIFAVGRLVDEGNEKNAALKAISDQLMPGRWDHVRQPNANELKVTSVVAFDIREASAKVRTGPPIDDDEDYQLDIWAGEVPLVVCPQTPRADGKLAAIIEVPQHVRDYVLSNRSL